MKIFDLGIINGLGGYFSCFCWKSIQFGFGGQLIGVHCGPSGACCQQASWIFLIWESQLAGLGGLCSCFGWNEIQFGFGGQLVGVRCSPSGACCEKAS